MLPDLRPPMLLLLHEGGWDEILMVAVGLGIAYVVIVWTGRRKQDEEDEWEEDDAPEADPPEAKTDQPPRHRS